MTTSNTVILILAAGNSSRLGKPKQLVFIDGIPLINKVITEAVESKATKVMVMLGAYSEDVQKILPEHPGRLLIENYTDWQQGMGATLKEGIKRVLDKIPDTTGVIVAGCDQPFVSYELFNQLIDQATKSIEYVAVASKYDQEIYGIPALFKKELFYDILTINSQQGAKQILTKNEGSISFVNFPQGKIDIDTQADLEKFKNGL